jgi:hypothetical protein
MVNNSTVHVSWTVHATCQWNGQAHVLSVTNVEAHAGSMPRIKVGSARWLKPRAVCHVAASGLRLSGEQEYMQPGPEPTRLGLDTCRHRTSAWVLFKARVCSVLRPWDPIVGGPDPIRGGPDPIPGVQLAHVEILDQPWRSGL